MSSSSCSSAQGHPTSPSLIVRANPLLRTLLCVQGNLAGMPEGRGSGPRNAAAAPSHVIRNVPRDSLRCVEADDPNGVVVLAVQQILDDTLNVVFERRKSPGRR